MSESKPVRACLCYPHTFAEIKALAAKNGWQTVGEITEALGCGSGCGLCRPYLQKMLETGEIAFAVLAQRTAQRGESSTDV
ncbi:MAG TPA: (2Fe-2S)-binding protein [Chthonomonadaceae bacterium]|nr:(2Fe-2S)-binding protein [Chthonomonadaceae bacterium]